MNRVIDVRAAASGDLLALLEIHVAQGSRPPGEATEGETATWGKMLARPGLTVYLGEEDRRVVGTATVMEMPNVTYECAPTLFIEAVVVLPDHRRRGIATAILRQALADAEERGCNKVQLLSHKRHASDGAHRLYTSLGFEAEAEGFRAYLMERRSIAR